jgi:hypothetical protein
MRFTAAIATMLFLPMAACQRSDSSRASETANGRTSGDSIVIQTTDGTINLGLVHDTVFMGLTDSVLAIARNDMARDTVETKGVISGTIEKFVKKKVSSALQKRLEYPLADIDSATYKGGSIKFAYRDRRTIAFEDVSRDKSRALNSFSPEDAEQFVAALNSAIHTVRGDSQ